MTPRSPEWNASQNQSGPSDILIVSGTITNVQGKPVKEVGLHFFLNGQKMELEEEVATSKAGGLKPKLKVPKGTLPAAKVELEAAKPSYQTSDRMHLDKVLPGKESMKRGIPLIWPIRSLKMKRAISPAFWIATLVLLLVYALIAFELMHRTLAALLGAALLMFITYTAGTFNPDYTILKFEDAMQGHGHERHLPAHGHDDHRRGDEKDRGLPVAGLQILSSWPGAMSSRWRPS